MLTLLALYGGLFLTALVAATLLPAQSELLLAPLLVQSGEPAWALITVATLGNSAGSAVNWWLGRYLTRFQDRRWFPFSPESLRKAEGWYHRYGRWTLLCSWMPVIGDPLTLVAGTLREPLPSFLLLVVLAKSGGGWCGPGALVIYEKRTPEGVLFLYPSRFYYEAIGRTGKI